MRYNTKDIDKCHMFSLIYGKNKKATDSSRRGTAENSQGCGGVGGKGRRMGKHDQTAKMVISTT